MRQPQNGSGRESKPDTIVVGFDGSRHARNALKWAADEARLRNVLLRILYAEASDPQNLPEWYEPGTSPLSPGQALVDDAYGLVATRHPSVVARAEIVAWPPAMVLTAATREAQLLVVGARGKGGFQGLLLGSVSDQSIQYAHCPVVVVHRDPDVTPLLAAQPLIVVGVDGSLDSTLALRWALDEAGRRSAAVHVVHAWQYPAIGTFVAGPKTALEAFSEEIIESAAEDAAKRAPSVPFTAATARGGTVPCLLDASRDAALLVLGGRGHGQFSRALIGSVAHQCARHASCDVVVARSSTPQRSEPEEGADVGVSVRKVMANSRR